MVTFLGHSIRYTLMTLGVVFLCIIIAVAISVEFFPKSQLTHRIQDAVANNPHKTASAGVDMRLAFRTALQNEVNAELGVPIEGYEPKMFLKVFPGLTETDFEGVQASAGQYTVAGGKLTLKIDETRLAHSAAGAINNHGMDTLLQNVITRLRLDISQDGTLTQIMHSLSRTNL